MDSSYRIVPHATSLQHRVWISPDPLEEERQILGGGRINVESFSSIGISVRPRPFEAFSGQFFRRVDAQFAAAGDFAGGVVEQRRMGLW
jgi:hypothetical protein